jgi:hypothetical protein
VIGLDLTKRTLNLPLARLGSQHVTFEIVASHGLNSSSVTIGPIFAPKE